MQNQKAMEEVAIAAAVNGDYGKALQVFTINPIITSGKICKKLLDQMLLANKKYLPQFKAVITSLEAEGVTYNPENYSIE